MMLVRSGGANFLMNFTSSYTSYYTKELGASNQILGYLSSVSALVSMIISMPAGWVSDRYNLKHVMGIGMAIQILMIALYAFAQNWVWILLAMVLNPFTMALMFRSQNVMISNSLLDTDRATGMGLRMITAQILGLLSPIPAAMLIEYFGGLSVEGIRPLYYFRLIGLTILYGYVYWKLMDVEPSIRVGKVNFLKDFREVFKDKKGLIPWIFVGGCGSLVWSTMQTFTIIWCVDVKGADAFTVGLMTTISTVAAIVFSLPSNRLADVKGRKYAFIITRPALWIWILIIVFAPHPSWLLVGWFFRGLGMSSSAYETIQVELVPAHQRGRWLGITNTFSALIRIFAPILGAYLYDSGLPALTFLVPLAVDSLIRTPLLMFKVPETLRKPS
ncbi:MAG: MFS transporter [Candidatus Bathyarchaeota archaeon]|nr:MFS transporter [Candidatus Bathyarchaeota archaeon]